MDATRPTQTPSLRISYRSGTTLYTARINDKIKKNSSTTEPSPFLAEESTTSGIAHHFYSPDGKIMALVKRIKNGTETQQPAPSEPVKLAPSGLPPVSGPPVAETRCIELYDVTYSNNNTKPVLIGRVPPNPNSGIFGVEDYVYFSPLSRYLVTWQPLERLKKGEGNLKIWDVKTGRLLVWFEQPNRQAWPVLRWTPNERLLVRLNQGQITVFNWQEFVSSPQVTSAKNAADIPPSEDEDAPAYQPIAQDQTAIQRETLREQAITDFSVTHSAVAVFIPERKGMPAKVMIFKLNDFSDVPTTKPGAKPSNKPAPEQDPEMLKLLPLIASQEPVATKSFFKADEVSMIWHNRGYAVLVLASTVQDSSGKNYYGETSLYFLSADGKLECNVVLDKPGPIHSVAWNPKGSGDFAVTYGYMPASTTLFDKRCRPTASLGAASRNTLLWSPHGRVLCVGGFYALSGEMEFWDTQTLTKLGTCRAYCSSSHVWSPDGRYLMASVLWPRLRVDNGIKIFNIFGQLVWSSGEMKELWQATWQPYIPHQLSGNRNTQSLHTYPRAQQPIELKDIYPDVDFDKILVSKPAHEAGVGNSSPAKPDASNAKAPAKPSGGAYKHPHWSGRASSGMSHHNVTEGPQKLTQPRTPVGGQLVGGQAASGNPKQAQQHYPVGFVPANPKAAAKNPGKQHRKKQPKQQNGTEGGKASGGSVTDNSQANK